MKLSTARKITVAAAFVLVVVGLIFNTGTGTLSSFGWQQIAAICPLGVVETFLANQTIFARALIVLGVALLFFGVFGKVFCAWLCPVPSLRELIGRIGKKKPQVKAAGTNEGEGNQGADLAGTSESEDTRQDIASSASEVAQSKRSAELTAKQLNLVNATLFENARQTAETSSASSVENTEAGRAVLSSSSPSAQPTAKLQSPNSPFELTDSEKASLSVSGCSSCVEKRKKFDSRHIVLGGSLLSAAIFGFPVFCLICPIGLTFGTIIIFWQWIGFNDISLSLLIYPAILVVELVVLKKWCTKICPLGALLSLMSLPNRLFRPKVDNNKCLRSQGIDCRVCVETCPEDLDPHSMQGMNECSKCGLCVEKCPTAAITLPLLNKKTSKIERSQ